MYGYTVEQWSTYVLEEYDNLFRYGSLVGSERYNDAMESIARLRDAMPEALETGSHEIGSLNNGNILRVEDGNIRMIPYISKLGRK